MTQLQTANLIIGMIANEPSGDILGAAIATQLKQKYPHVRIVGVAGPRMMEVGCESFVDMDRLAVMGLAEIVRHLPELISIRKAIFSKLLALQPVVVIGIDAPDFNLALERKLKDSGIPTIHVVCPSVWAWRSGRVKTIRKAVDLLLCLFPFEVEFLRKHQVTAAYIGHPIADQIPVDADAHAARMKLGLPANRQIVALLPGSRRGEITHIARDFIATAWQCQQLRPELEFVTPMLNPSLRSLFEQQLQEVAPKLRIQIVDGQSREAMAAADMVLTVSGTATLETMLLQKPMLVGYKMSALTYRILKIFKLIKVRFIALANILADEELAPEFIQERCTPEYLVPELLSLLDDGDRRATIAERYKVLHLKLRNNAAERAADEISNLLRSRQA